MNLKRIFLALLIGMACCGITTLAHAGEIRYDEFKVTLTDINSLEGGSGTGYTDPDGGGPWYEYPVLPTDPGYPSSWWNQWFWNDPPGPEKWIEWNIDLSPTGDVAAVVEVALNWTTADYYNGMPSEGGHPPLPGEGAEDNILRYTVFLGEVDGTEHAEGRWWLPFNPAWVSIDVRVLTDLNAAGQIVPLGGGVFIEGDITHQCVAPIPEPTSLLLLGTGLGILWLGTNKRRKK